MALKVIPEACNCEQTVFLSVQLQQGIFPLTGRSERRLKETIRDDRNQRSVFLEAWMHS